MTHPSESPKLLFQSAQIIDENRDSARAASEILRGQV